MLDYLCARYVVPGIFFEMRATNNTGLPMSLENQKTPRTKKSLNIRKNIPRNSDVSRKILKFPRETIYGITVLSQACH